MLSNDAQYYNVNGVRLAVSERPGTGPPILFVHATGFHARCWNQIVARIPGRRCIAVDMRGHGLSSKPDPPYYWHTFGEDVAALARLLGLHGVTGAGHSMGGHSLVVAAGLAPGIFSDLLLIDPVILPRIAYMNRRWTEHFARKRRNRWSTPDEMFDRFKDRPPFRDWDVAVLRDYCDYGLVPASDGDGYVLACPPEIEGAIYEASGLDDANLYGKFELVDVPVTVMRSATPLKMEPAMDMAASPTAPDLATHFPRGRDMTTPHSHFIPMEDPQLIAELLSSTQA